MCLCLCLVYVYQSRISSTHEFYIMINIVNKTKHILASKKKLLYWNGYNDIGGQSASWFFVIAHGTWMKAKTKSKSTACIAYSINTIRKAEVIDSNRTFASPFFLSRSRLGSIFPNDLLCPHPQMQQPLYGFAVAFALLPIALWISVHILYITQLGYDAIFRK